MTRSMKCYVSFVPGKRALAVRKTGIIFVPLPGGPCLPGGARPDPTGGVGAGRAPPTSTLNSHSR